ncbi:hypothetical protein G5714_007561 [Onychostoma macrolepis]|uniref:Uncharacterized protein n=1 Tax=Onychostoma macrolepis TaxID=369639 RepID=A0A7J6CTE1_9TELE|nr:hypothetical protein G5714_007561 [Onychostoma macrolepis]
MSREVSVAQGCNGQLTEDRIPGKDREDEPESQTLEQQSDREREDKHQGSDKTRRAQGCNGQLTEDGIPGKDREDEPESETLEQQSDREREDKHQGSDKTRRG